MEKLVIVIFGTSGTGKTTTVKEIINDIFTWPEAQKCKIPAAHGRNDIAGIFSIKGKKIGVESMGDPGSKLGSRLSSLVTSNCDLIITTSRTYGSTSEDIMSECADYNIVWFRSEHYNQTNGKIRTKSNKETALYLIKAFLGV